jgi:PKD repeat protein
VRNEKEGLWMLKRAFLLILVILLAVIVLRPDARLSIAEIDNPKINESSDEVFNAHTQTCSDETTGGARGEVRCVQWYPDSPYASTQANSSLEQLKAAISGCNYLQLKCELNTTQDTVTALTNTSMLADAISTARQFGYKVIMRIQSLRGAHNLTLTDADAWFASYADVVEQYAILAEDHGVEGFCFAVEFSLLEVAAYNSKWLNLISQFREVYSGKLSYETNYWANKTGEFNSFEQKLNTAWFSELDYIAVSAYWELANATGPTVSDLVSSWHNYRGTRETNATPSKPWLVGDIVETLNNLSQTFNKKILIVSGIASAEGACMTPYRYGPAYDSVNLSLEEQENWYEALFQVFQNKSWIAGYEFDGAWSTTPNVPIKKDFFIQGKPAQDVVNTWFANHPPVTNFTYDPLDPTIETEIVFNASSTYDLDEDIASFTWDFDDGNISSTPFPTIAHSYAVPRTYNVTLTVTDVENLYSSYSARVKIRFVGDVNGDGTVNMSDITYLISRFNSKPASFNWDPKTDINNDLVCNMRDISIALLNFGKLE